MMRRRRFSLAAVLFATTFAVTSLATSPTAYAESGTDAIERPPLAATPPMGWNSWNSFGKSIDENLAKQQVDAMVNSGMKDAGYEYFVIDGGWRAKTRDASGNMQVDLEKFPSGMKALADYVHAKGLKFGLHVAVGMTDCGSETPGTQSAPGGEQQDADVFASWGVDFIKYDLCRYEYPAGATFEQQKEITKAAYERMAVALENTGRPIVYSISEYGKYQPWEWAPRIADMWRTTTDIWNCFDCRPSSKLDVTEILDRNAVRGLGIAGPDSGWNDPDMLMVGVNVRLQQQHPVPDIEMTTEEARSHFSLWSMMAAPLIASADMAKMSESIRDIHTNREVIAVDQDPLGVQGQRVRDDGDLEVWSKPLADGSRAVVLFNRGDAAASITTTADEVGLERHRPGFVQRDLWSHTSVFTTGTISSFVQPHDVAMFRVWPGVPDDAAPATSLSVTGSDLVAGDAAEVRATLQNHGRSAIDNLSLTLDVPSGWIVEPAPVPDNLPPGRTFEMTWSVRAPSGSEPGITDLIARASYTSGDDHEPGGVSARTTVKLAPTAQLSLTVTDDRSGSTNTVRCGVPCNSATPWLVAGQTIGVTITNNAAQELSDLAFDVQAPEGWIATAASQSEVETLQPGGSADATWQITAGPGAQPGVAEFDTSVTYVYKNEQVSSDEKAAVRVLMSAPPTSDIGLSDLDWASASNQLGPVERDTSNGERTADDGGPISIAGATYSRGLGVHAPSQLAFDLGGNCSRFTADVGVDDEENGAGSVAFHVFADGVEVYDSGVVRGGTPAQSVDVGISGVQELRLVLTNAQDGNSFDHGDWANPVVTCAAG